MAEGFACRCGGVSWAGPYISNHTCSGLDMGCDFRAMGRTQAMFSGAKEQIDFVNIKSLHPGLWVGVKT